MYQIINAAKLNVQEYTLSGTIDGVAFSGDRNIVAGSCSYQNQCADTSNFNLGYVYTGIFKATFINVEINRNDWEGVEIVPVVTIGNVEVPVGHFFVSKADHAGGVVAVTAADAMEKFKKPTTWIVGYGGMPYDLLQICCTECGVTLGMTAQEVQALPNGTQPLALLDAGDIEQWIDVIYWVSQQLGGFATIDRNGRLVIRTYHNTTDDTMPADVRFNSKYGDEKITYTGLYVNNMAEQKAEYYSAQVDNGYNVKLGSNPFMQVPKATRDIYCNNLITALANIEYNSFEISIPFGCHYDLSDVLAFPNGDGDSNAKYCIMYISWTFGGECKLRGIPKPAKSISKTDKSIQGLLSTVGKNEFRDYVWKNSKNIAIAENKNVRLLIQRLASNNSTRAVIHIEVNLESLASAISDDVTIDTTAVPVKADGDSIFRLVSDNTTQGIVTYVINSEEVAFKPIEQWVDGNHILHLMYVLGLEGGIVAQFEVYMKAQRGAISIPQGGILFYASGRGLVGDGKWDGSITVIDEVSGWAISEIAYESASDSVSIVPQTPTQIAKTEVANAWSISEISYESATDTIHITLRMDSRPRITEDGKLRITEDGSTRYTEGD